MARQRMVKPEFFDSESLSQCTIPARLAFIGLWVESDDYGRCKAQIVRLKKRIFPYDSMSFKRFVQLLAELESVGCIKGYEVDGEAYICVPNFGIYQTVNRPSKSVIPEPPKSVEKAKRTRIFSECSVSAHGVLTLKKEVKKEAKESIDDSLAKEDVASGADAETAPTCSVCHREAIRNPHRRDKWMCPKCMEEVVS